MKKLAIIGASSFQNPLILKAKEMGLETHVFAWACGDVGEFSADVFHPISIVEKEQILEECYKIGIDGICSIASDLANITVAYVAARLGLVANSEECVHNSTDKYAMRQVFERCGDPSPKSMLLDAQTDLLQVNMTFPSIVKPTDRSGSRGVTRIEHAGQLIPAVAKAFEASFDTTAVVEEFIEGREFSAEVLSWKGQHTFLALTEKFTTGAPAFIERGHLQPARVNSETVDAVRDVVLHALDSLGVEYGASHAELKITAEGRIYLIEIGSRMGGDCIGSSLVQLSCGYDFVRAVIDVALGNKPQAFVPDDSPKVYAAIRFVFGPEDVTVLDALQRERPEALVYQTSIEDFNNHAVTDSSTRYGYYVFVGSSIEDIQKYLPEEGKTFVSQEKLS